MPRWHPVCNASLTVQTQRRRWIHYSATTLAPGYRLVCVCRVLYVYLCVCNSVPPRPFRALLVSAAPLNTQGEVK